MKPALRKIADYIIKMAITGFNFQYGHELDWRDFQIVSMPTGMPDCRTCCAFEITEIIKSKYFRIHLYTTLGEENTIGEFWLSDIEDYAPGIQEKVYAVPGVFNDQYLYLNNNIIRRECPVFPSPDSQLNCLIEEPFIHGLLSEQDEYLLPETETELIVPVEETEG